MDARLCKQANGNHWATANSNVNIEVSFRWNPLSTCELTNELTITVDDRTSGEGERLGARWRAVVAGNIDLHRQDSVTPHGC